MKHLAIIIASLAAGPVAAQEAHCVSSEVMTAVLDAKYGEQIAAVGVVNDGYTIRIFANPETRSWTIVGVPATGCVAILSHGTDYEPYEMVTGDPA